MTTAAKNISSADTHTAAMEAPRVLIAAGGTGGHVYPGIAIADALKELQPVTGLLFAGTRDRMEWDAVPKAGYEIAPVWISGFHRRLTPQNLLFPVKLLASLFQSFSILRKFRPDIVISCGGFASGPVGWVAARLGIPVVLQEQNSYPGVTNRLLAKHAEDIFISFVEASEYFPEGKTTLTGNPVRAGLIGTDRTEALNHFGFREDRPVLLVLGGSGGARSINDAMEHHLGYLHDDLGLQIIWQCGKHYHPQLAERIDTDTSENLRLLEFIDHMPAAYGAADLVISRAGAISCSELMLTGKPSILIPSPHVAGDHQVKNAAVMVLDKAAVQLKDQEAREQLGAFVGSLIFDTEELGRMSRAAQALAKPDAAQEIAQKILSRIGKQL